MVKHYASNAKTGYHDIVIIAGSMILCASSYVSGFLFVIFSALISISLLIIYCYHIVKHVHLIKTYTFDYMFLIWF